jgi:hypothetical protein
MVEIKSTRAQNFLTSPQAREELNAAEMRRYPSDDFKLWVKLHSEHQVVKKLSFAGELESYEVVLLEALASLLQGRSLGILENLSLRECEAYLRDRNSELALSGLPSEDEARFRKLFTWLRLRPWEVGTHREYEFAFSKGPFHKLKLVDKITELKAFLNSSQVQLLYQGHLLPELVDVEELTVYLQAPYHSESERGLFEELHLLGVNTFKEEQLNFIPDA